MCKKRKRTGGQNLRTVVILDDVCWTFAADVWTHAGIEGFQSNQLLLEVKFQCKNTRWQFWFTNQYTYIFYQ